jgi:hypothetical protein
MNTAGDGINELIIAPSPDLRPAPLFAPTRKAAKRFLELPGFKRDRPAGQRLVRTVFWPPQVSHRLHLHFHAGVRLVRLGQQPGHAYPGAHRPGGRRRCASTDLAGGLQSQSELVSCGFSKAAARPFAISAAACGSILFASAPSALPSSKSRLESIICGLRFGSNDSGTPI